MKKKLSLLKELWKDPKKHAFLVLGLYVLFFFCIYLYIMISTNTRSQKPIYQTPVQKLNTMTHYQYQIDINDEIIKGIVVDDKNTFFYQEEEYTYQEGVPYEKIVYYANTKNIYHLIHNQEIYSKTEYNDQRISKVYKLDHLEIITYELTEQIYQIEVKTEQDEFIITYQN